jgi:hypothetical protein
MRTRAMWAGVPSEVYSMATLGWCEDLWFEQKAKSRRKMKEQLLFIILLYTGDFKQLDRQTLLLLLLLSICYEYNPEAVLIRSSSK